MYFNHRDDKESRSKWYTMMIEDEDEKEKENYYTSIVEQWMATGICSVFAKWSVMFFASMSNKEQRMAMRLVENDEEMSIWQNRNTDDYNNWFNRHSDRSNKANQFYH